MSVDEFDPDIERLFARTPHLADAPLFAARVETRLDRGSRFRVVALGLAGAIGAAVAIRETVTVDLNISASEGQGVVAGEALGQGLSSASAGLRSLTQGALDQVGLSGLELGSMGGMQMFWLAAGALVALAAAGVMRLSQEV